LKKKKSRKAERIFLFTASALATNDKISEEMDAFLLNLRKKEHIAIVFGSGLSQQTSMLGEHVLTDYDYVFEENGVVVHKDSQHLHTKTIIEHLGEDKLKAFTNFCLHYIADLDLPIKRGTFYELQNGSIHICPVGRSASKKDREVFEDYDKKHKIRAQFVTALEEKFGNFNMTYYMPDNISIEVIPQGWDTSYCLQHLELEKYGKIHFFGTKTAKGELDHHIFIDKRVVGHKVTSPEDTMKQVSEL